MPELVEPSAVFADSFRAGMADFAAEGRGRLDDGSALGREIREFDGRWQRADGLAEFIEHLRRAGDPAIPPPIDWVHTSTYWFVDGLTYLGSIRIRHRLGIPRLLETAGHIGYDIAPGCRHKGYGTAMLKAALPRACDLGLDLVLVTCASDNVGSRKIIEANGGRFEDEREDMLRYWLPTSPA